MIEQLIENKIATKLTNALRQVGIEDFQCATQLEAVEGVKGLENEKGVILTIKASPRSYATATIPTCQIDVTMNALVRADKDWHGTTYLGVTSALMDVLEHWQKCYPDTHVEFSVPNKFRCVGYQLDTGSFGLDQTGKVWNYEHSMTIYGVILEEADTNETQP